jgi:hypothetical protein
MRIQIDHKEKTEGLFKKKTFVEVELDVQFSQEELAVIDKHKLEKTIVMERAPPHGGSHEPHMADVYHLSFWRLVHNHPDKYAVASHAEAKAYEAELIAALKQAKSYLEANAAPAEKSKVLEL